jgi:hypothetical protein
MPSEIVPQLSASLLWAAKSAEQATTAPDAAGWGQAAAGLAYAISVVVEKGRA